MRYEFRPDPVLISTDPSVSINPGAGLSPAHLYSDMKKDWREIWEENAARERNAHDALPVNALLEKVSSGDFGNYYTIWYSISARSDLKHAGWILFDVLNRDIHYLYRYHCAAALISLLYDSGYQAVQLSSENHNHRENLECISRLLQKRIGGRADV